MHSGMLFWIGGALVGLGGLALLAWALFADRSRGRRRCPKCWYDMSQAQKSSDGGGGWRCPECGREIRKERRLLRTRRRWKWALASLLVFGLAGYLAIQPKVREDGWASVMPATVLIFALDMRDPQWALDGLLSRTERDVSQAGYAATGLIMLEPERLFVWQWEIVVDRCMEIIDGAYPPATRWAAMNLLQRAGFEADDAVIDALHDLYWKHALDADQRISRWATISLGGDWDEQRGLKRLQSLLAHENPKIRANAVTGLRMMIAYGSDLSVPTLIDAMNDENRDVRMRALGAITSSLLVTPDKQSIFDAVLRALKDSDSSVRRHAAYRLSFFPDQQSRVHTLLAELVRSEDDALRAGALMALAQMEDRPEWAVASTLAGLQDSSPSVREGAIALLDVLSAEELQSHVDHLSALADHVDPEVSRAVHSRLDELAYFAKHPIQEP
jgi:hypothetical protein